jgi:3',5'-cyclic AMP phosphodiesterase CpdA
MNPGSLRPLRIALTADLHYGIRASGDAATHQLVAHLAEKPPDLLVMAGDVGAGDNFERCLALFAGLPSRKALVPGNHDVWVTSDDARGDSLGVYREHLPAVCERHGFHYLDRGPLSLPDSDLAIAGSMNWYDYSWSIEQLKEIAPDWEQRLRTKRFTRGRHNDVNYVRWQHTDESFTGEVVASLERHIDEGLAAAGSVIVVTHHSPFRALNYPPPPVRALDDLLWEAFAGNARLEEALRARAQRIPLAFCGHTHFAREGELAGIRGFNVGGDYHFKRLLSLDWPTLEVSAMEFGSAAT